MRKLAVAAAGFLFALPAFAEVVTFEYTGIVNAIRDDTSGRTRQVAQSSVIPGSVQIGDSFHGSFSYDTSVPLTTSAGSDYGSFFSYESTWQVPPAVLVIDRSGVTVLNDFGHPYVWMNKGASSTMYILSNPHYDASEYGGVGVNFFNGNNAFPTFALPQQLNLDAFYHAYADFSWYNGNHSMHAEGILTSIANVSAVPEPSSYILLFVGLAIVAGGASRSKRNRIEPD